MSEDLKQRIKEIIHSSGIELVPTRYDETSFYPENVTMNDLENLVLLTIKECSLIAKDADSYRVPASQYANLISSFKRLEDNDDMD